MLVNNETEQISLPLCVDLDGTLIHSDVLMESTVNVLRRNPFFVFLLPFWLIKGRAFLKQEIARRSTFDVRDLPYNEELLTFLKKAHKEGRTIVLSTAANKKPADEIAHHLGFFDKVLASDGETNLKGQKKAALLRQVFGTKKFDYIGNSHIDLAVWKEAAHGILVGGSEGLADSMKKILNLATDFRLTGLGWEPFFERYARIRH